jgi:hypothetical protein
VRLRRLHVHSILLVLLYLQCRSRGRLAQPLQFDFADDQSLKLHKRLRVLRDDPLTVFVIVYSDFREIQGEMWVGEGEGEGRSIILTLTTHTHPPFPPIALHLLIVCSLHIAHLHMHIDIQSLFLLGLTLSLRYMLNVIELNSATIYLALK